MPPLFNHFRNPKKESWDYITFNNNAAENLNQGYWNIPSWYTQPLHQRKRGPKGPNMITKMETNLLLTYYVNQLAADIFRWEISNLTKNSILHNSRKIISNTTNCLDKWHQSQLFFKQCIKITSPLPVDNQSKGIHNRHKLRNETNI